MRYKIQKNGLGHYRVLIRRFFVWTVLWINDFPCDSYVDYEEAVMVIQKHKNKIIRLKKSKRWKDVIRF